VKAKTIWPGAFKMRIVVRTYEWSVNRPLVDLDDAREVVMAHCHAAIEEGIAFIHMELAPCSTHMNHGEVHVYGYMPGLN
jgi:hypothetical protein